MNIYDFDNTIYDGDSSVDFYLYCAAINKRCLQKFPTQLMGATGYLFRIFSKEKMKECLFSYLTMLPSPQSMVTEFWKVHERKITPWYLAQKNETDIIISASPEFLLAPICQKLNVTLIASRVDISTGLYNGKNCHGHEKVRRLMEFDSNVVVDSFYSDSWSDAPLAKLAKQSFMVKNPNISKWY